MSAYEWLIGTRYLRSTHRRGFVSFVALMSVCGLMLGVATLIVVLSVMNGFERELRSRILARHLARHHHRLDGPLSDWPPLQQQAAQPAGRAGGGAVHREPGDARHTASALPGASVRGVLPAEERRATGLAQHISGGRIEDLLRRRLPHHSRQRARARAERARRRRGGADRARGHGHADRGRAAHAPLPGGRHLRFGYVRVRPRARARQPGRCGAAVSHRRGRHRPAAGVRRSAARAGAGARRWRSRSAAGLLRQRLDAGSRQLLPLHRDHQVDDVRHPAACSWRWPPSTSSRRSS